MESAAPHEYPVPDYDGFIKLLAEDALLLQARRPAVPGISVKAALQAQLTEYLPPEL